MQYGIHLPPFGDFADPSVLAEMAREAEDAGWDGFFLWDHMIFDPTFHPIVDAWVGLAAVAMRTKRMTIGPLITPLARRRPQKVARETVSVDRLSNGRLVLGVGLGDPVQWDFGFFGDPVDARVRAAMLDEGLEVLNALWSGKLVEHQGVHYPMQPVRFEPIPVQRPRIPVWVAGWWPHRKPLRRAARWDGVCPGKWEGGLTPGDWQELLAYIARYRESMEGFAAVHTGGKTSGTDHGGDAATVAAYAEAGVTWWVEDVSPWRFGARWEDHWTPEFTSQMRERILEGPPRE